MRLRCPACLFLIALAGLQTLHAQSRPSVYVNALNPIGVSKQEADAAGTYLETSLSETEAFEMIEQKRAAELLDAQEYSNSDCTDEACAIQIGKLLAANEVVLGDFSSIGGKFVLSAKLIDCQTGKIVKASRQEFAKIGDVTTAAETLAFDLAGMTRSATGQVSSKYGEIFVQTEPFDKAEILINGVSKGRSPELFSRIPLGKVKIEARLDKDPQGNKVNLYAVREVEVTENLGTVDLKLEQQYTNLFIKSSATDVVVYLDGVELGPLGSGMLQNLPAPPGDHKVELKGAGVYWSGSVTLKNGETARVTATPREFGSISYVIPEGASAEIVSLDSRQVVRGVGNIDVMYAGRYTVSVTGERFDRQVLSLTVNRNQTATLSPAMKLTRAAMYKDFDAAIRAVEGTLAGDGEIQTSLQTDVDKIRQNLKGAGDGFGDLVTRADTAAASVKDRLQTQADQARVLEAARQKQERLAALTTQRDNLAARLKPLEQKRVSKGIAALVWLGLAAAGGGAAAAGRILGEEAFTAYGAAQTTADAISLRGRTHTLDIVFVSGAVGTGLALLASLISVGTRPTVTSEREELQRLESQIQEIR